VCEDSFYKLKRTFTQAPILKLMDYTKDEQILCTDASEEAIGAVLMQEGHVVAYESRKLNLTIFFYPTHEKELIIRNYPCLKSLEALSFGKAF
jgi:hypothetical protein